MKNTHPVQICAAGFTITRNAYFSELRKRKREVSDSDGMIAEHVPVRGGQEGATDLTDMMRALHQLSDEQREAVMLVGASDLSYEETAAICGVPVGTIKSRVSRARSTLAELLGMTSLDEVDVDSTTQVVLGQTATLSTLR